MNGADDVADALGRLKHGRRVHQRFALAGFRIVIAFSQYADHRLADRQISRRRDRHDALLRILEDVKFADGRDVVDAGIGPRVGEHHQPLAHQNATAISHRLTAPPCGLYNISPLRSGRREAYWPTLMATSSVSLPDP